MSAVRQMILANGGKLAAVVGVAAAAGLMSLTPKWEGTKLTTYRDIGGVLTYCTGATENAQWGKTYTPQECAKQLDKDLARHAEGIKPCLPWDKLTTGQRVAFVDTAYNIGVNAFCGSSMSRKAKAGDMIGACAALTSFTCITVAPGKGDRSGACVSEKVNKKFVQGVFNRRAEVRAICEGRKT